MNKERTLSIVLAVLIALMYRETFQFPASTWSTYNPTLFPRVILIILAFLTVILFIRSFKGSRERKEKLNRKELFSNYWRAIVLFPIIGIYILLLQKIGFISSTILFMFSVQVVLMGINKKSLALNAAVTFTSTFLVYFIFQKVLMIWLP